MAAVLDDLLTWAAEQGLTDDPSAGTNIRGGSKSCLGRVLQVAHFPEAGGRGLVALRDIRKGEVILHAPRGVLLTGTPSTSEASRAVSCAASTAGVALSPEQCLAAVLLWEMSRGVESPWRPYLVHLPRRYSTLLSWTPQQRQQLQVPWAVECAKRAAEDAEASWQGASPVLRELGLKRRFCSLAAWLWAVASVSSRTLFVPWDAAGALCPVVDLLNFEPLSFNPPPAPASTPAPEERPQESAHSPMDSHSDKHLDDTQAHCNGRRDGGMGSSSAAESSPREGGIISGKEGLPTEAQMREEDSGEESDQSGSCRDIKPDRRGLPHSREEGDCSEGITGFVDGGFDSKCDAYRIYARRDFRKGEQVCICYGQYTSLELLEHYGFLLPHNPDDSVPIPLPCTPDLLLNLSQWEGDKCRPEAGRPVRGWRQDGVRKEANEDPFEGPCAPKFCILSNGAPSFLLLALLRLWVTPPHRRQQSRHVALSGATIAKEGDKAAYRWLALKCQDILSALPSCLEEDESELTEMLSATGASSSVDGGGVNHKDSSVSAEDVERNVLALQWRIGWKGVLRKCIKHCIDSVQQPQT